MNFFPVVPLPRFLVEMTSLKLFEFHQGSAYALALGMAFFGTFLLLLWVPGYKNYGVETRALAKERIRGGFGLYIIGLLFLIFGAYAMAAFVIGLATLAIYSIARGAKIAFSN